MTRTKFVVSERTEHAGGQVGVRLGAVYTGSEENKAFWEATPSGEITLMISKGHDSSMFKPGREIYVDFTEVPES